MMCRDDAKKYLKKLAVVFQMRRHVLLKRIQFRNRDIHL